jgi:hypothetical protein
VNELQTVEIFCKEWDNTLLFRKKVSRFIFLEITQPPLMRALAKVLWLCVISREGNFVKGIFLNNGVSSFLSMLVVFESIWGTMVHNPLHFFCH